jgi:hypothetical protein
MAPVLAATVIEIGDLLYLDNGTAKPASAQADTETEAGNQEAFHDKFLGVALAASRDGDTAAIRVATRGAFEFACPSGTFILGALLGPKEDAAGTALENQAVKSVATPNLALGRCTQAVTTASTRVLLEIVSTVLHGGPQVMA